MKKTYLILIISLLIASCTPSTPMPTETPTPTATATATLTPTPTPTATATPEPWIALAEEYDMPEEIARQLSEMDVSFQENPSPYVDGILVVDNETGADTFFYSEKYNFWVACDEFEGVEKMSDTTARSVEMSAWLYYKALKYDFNLEGYRDSLAKMLAAKVTDGSMTVEQASETKNFPMKYYNSGGVPYVGLDYESILTPEDGGLLFVKDMGVVIEIEDISSPYFDKNVFIPIALLNLETGKVVIVKGILQGGENNIDNILDNWIIEMEVPFVITWSSKDNYFNRYDPESTLLRTEKVAKESGIPLDERIFLFSRGDPSALDDAGILMEFMSW